MLAKGVRIISHDATHALAMLLQKSGCFGATQGGQAGVERRSPLRELEGLFIA